MPTYQYRCGSCRDESDRDYTMGEAPRLVRCNSEGCGGSMQQVIGVGVQIAPSALENKGAAVRHINTKDERLDADMTSYKRMRRRGLQPERIDGARLIENEVNDNFDIKFKKKLTAVAPDEPWVSTRERAREAMEQAQDSGWVPTKATA